jgi:ribulose-5-phosphate 4-epimerase/fuculose-1-phosphate aldolase
MKRKPPKTTRSSPAKRIEQELKIAATILEWEIGDIWGHVGVRLPDKKGIAVQMFRRAESEDKDWLVSFDYALNKLSGVGTIPRESVIYTEIFKARPDVNAAVHCHASMCIALSLADKPVD